MVSFVTICLTLFAVVHQSWGGDLLKPLSSDNSQAVGHQWQAVSSGSLIGAILDINRSLFADRDFGKLEIIVSCDVSQATPIPFSMIRTTDLGVRALGRSMYRVSDSGEFKFLALLEDGCSPQNVIVAPGLVRSFIKDLTTGSFLQLQFVDAFGSNRDLSLSVSNPSDLVKMLAPCVP